MPIVGWAGGVGTVGPALGCDCWERAGEKGAPSPAPPGLQNQFESKRGGASKSEFNLPFTAP